MGFECINDKYTFKYVVKMLHGRVLVFKITTNNHNAYDEMLRVLSQQYSLLAEDITTFSIEQVDDLMFIYED